MFFPCLLYSIVSGETSGVNFIVVSMHVMSHFSHVVFRIFSFIFGLHHFDCGSLCVYPVWSLLTFLDFLSILGSSQPSFFSMISIPFSHSWFSYYTYVGALNGVPHFSETVL